MMKMRTKQEFFDLALTKLFRQGHPCLDKRSQSICAYGNEENPREGCIIGLMMRSEYRKEYLKTGGSIVALVRESCARISRAVQMNLKNPSNVDFLSALQALHDHLCGQLTNVEWRRKVGKDAGRLAHDFQLNTKVLNSLKWTKRDIEGKV